jgi:hypothetical protein
MYIGPQLQKLWLVFYQELGKFVSISYGQGAKTQEASFVQMVSSSNAKGIRRLGHKKMGLVLQIFGC